jgi:LDH2 family malate/lactate/ureidoglycolate dehydrogenase
VDLLTGVLAGAAFGPNILGLFSTAGESNLGQAVIVIDPAALEDPGQFETRLECYLEQLIAAPTVPGRVLIPGEPEAEAAGRADVAGVVIDRVHAANLAALGARLGVPFPS